MKCAIECLSQKELIKYFPKSLFNLIGGPSGNVKEALKALNESLHAKHRKTYREDIPHDPFEIIESIQQLLLDEGIALKLPCLFRRCKCGDEKVKANIVVTDDVVGKVHIK